MTKKFTSKKKAAKPVAKAKKAKVVPKKTAKPKKVKKPAVKKTMPTVRQAIPKKVKKTVAKPKVQLKKKVIKTKVKVQPKKKYIKTSGKKITIKTKQKIAKKPVKKVLKPVTKPVKPKKVISKPVIIKQEQLKQPEIKKTVELKVPENPVVPKIIRHPKIVALKNVLKFEANYNRADMFYKNVLKAEIIKRFSCSKPEDREFIEKDQNLLIKMNDRESAVSEKARDQDWNDIYVEIFKKYPYEEGWIKSTEAEYIAYFFPGRVFWAKMEPLKALCYDILCKAIDSGIYKELSYMYPKNSGRLSKTFKINTKTYSFNFIQTYHEHGENSYYSIGISLPFVLLMDFRIDYKIFKQ
jgi:hypothetical protein